MSAALERAFATAEREIETMTNARAAMAVALSTAEADVADAESKFTTHDTDANWAKVEAARSKRDRLSLSIKSADARLSAARETLYVATYQLHDGHATIARDEALAFARSVHDDLVAIARLDAEIIERTNRVLASASDQRAACQRGIEALRELRAVEARRNPDRLIVNDRQLGADPVSPKDVCEMVSATVAYTRARVYPCDAAAGLTASPPAYPSPGAIAFLELESVATELRAEYTAPPVPAVVVPEVIFDDSVAPSAEGSAAPSSEVA